MAHAAIRHARHVCANAAALQNARWRSKRTRQKQRQSRRRQRMSNGCSSAFYAAKRHDLHAQIEPIVFTRRRCHFAIDITFSVRPAAFFFA